MIDLPFFAFTHRNPGLDLSPTSLISQGLLCSYGMLSELRDTR